MNNDGESVGVILLAVETRLALAPWPMQQQYRCLLDRALDTAVEIVHTNTYAPGRRRRIALVVPAGYSQRPSPLVDKPPPDPNAVRAMFRLKIDETPKQDERLAAEAMTRDSEFADRVTAYIGKHQHGGHVMVQRYHANSTDDYEYRTRTARAVAAATDLMKTVQNVVVWHVERPYWCAQHVRALLRTVQKRDVLAFYSCPSFGYGIGGLVAMRAQHALTLFTPSNVYGTLACTILNATNPSRETLCVQPTRLLSASSSLSLSSSTNIKPYDAVRETRDLCDARNVRDAEWWAERGVLIVDPATTFLAVDEIGAGSILWPNTTVRGIDTQIGSNCLIGPNAFIDNARLQEGCIVEHGALVRDCWLRSHTRVPANTCLEDVKNFSDDRHAMTTSSLAISPSSAEHQEQHKWISSRGQKQLHHRPSSPEGTFWDFESDHESDGHYHHHHGDAEY